MSMKGAHFIKHGLSKVHPVEYRAWKEMRARCSNPNIGCFAHYGGRGIKVCARWDEFPAFLEDMGEKPTKGHSLDRIDVDGNYEPGNCRWATAKVQSNNRTSNRMVEIDGVEQTFQQWCDHFGVEQSKAFHRMKAGRPWHQVFSPVNLR